MAMPHYDCADFILKPNLPKPMLVDHREVQLTMTKYNVNEPQARAISSALRTDGFSLIQGHVFLVSAISSLTILLIGLPGLARRRPFADWYRHFCLVAHSLYRQMAPGRQIRLRRRRFFSVRPATLQSTRSRIDSRKASLELVDEVLFQRLSGSGQTKP